MALTLSNDSKNSLSVTNEDKSSGSTITWDEAYFTWDEGDFDWEHIGLPGQKETKNTLNLTNESKN